MEENKLEFVHKLGNLLKETSMCSDLKALCYVDRKEAGEYVYAVYEGNLQKRINVAASSCWGIVGDIHERLERNDWLTPDRKLNEGEVIRQSMLDYGNRFWTLSHEFYELPDDPDKIKQMNDMFFEELSKTTTADDFVNHIDSDDVHMIDNDLTAQISWLTNGVPGTIMGKSFNPLTPSEEPANDKEFFDNIKKVYSFVDFAALISDEEPDPSMSKAMRRRLSDMACGYVTYRDNLQAPASEDISGLAEPEYADPGRSSDDEECL